MKEKRESRRRWKEALDFFFFFFFSFAISPRFFLVVFIDVTSKKFIARVKGVKSMAC